MRVLFVAMPNSIHTVRWMNQFRGLGWDVHLFPSYEADVEPELRDATVHPFSATRPTGLHASVAVRGLWPLRHGAYALERVVRRRLPVLGPAARLARLIDRLRPDLVHSLEFQQAGYLTLEARKKVRRRFPPWLVSSWGSDTYLFGRLAEHRDRVRAVLAAADYFGCECTREQAIVRRLGFTGAFLPVVPAAGGFDIGRARSLRSPGPTSARRIILVKGYQNVFGRALVAVRALERCADQLAEYRIVVTSAAYEVQVACELLAQSSGLTIECAPRIGYDEVLRRMGQARLMLGLSISDGIPTSLLEAMLMGCFPIQSDTACSNEWIVPGRTGLLVPAEDPDAIAAALRRALEDDALVDQAALVNQEVAEARADLGVVRSTMIAAYQRIAQRTQKEMVPS